MERRGEKTLFVAVAAVLTALSVHAAEEPAVPRSDGQGWRTLVRFLPGGYRFIDRFPLSAEQRRALTRIYRDWEPKRYEACLSAMRKLPPLSDQDRKDPAKVRARRAKARELLRKSEIPPPVEQVRKVLTAGQRATILRAEQVLASWGKWVNENMPTYERKLDAVLGPAPEGTDPRAWQELQRHVNGAELLGRLGLTKAQETAIRRLSAAARQAAYAEAVQLLRPGGGTADRHLAAVRAAVVARIDQQVSAKTPQALLKLLTSDQRTRFLRALDVVKERDQAVCKRYSKYAASIRRIFDPAPSPRKREPAPTRP